MNNSIIITKKLDPLTKEEWEFVLIDDVLYLNLYRVTLYENTRKRVGKILKVYSRLQHRIDRYSPNLIKSEDVPLTEEIKKEVLEMYLKKLKVIRWEERGGK